MTPADGRRDPPSGGSPANAAPATPGPGAAGALLLIVAFLFIVGGAPLQILLGEPALLIAQVAFLLVPTILFVRWRGYDPVRTFSLRWPERTQLVGGVVCLAGGTQIAWFLAWAQSLVVPVPVEYLEALTTQLQADSVGRFLWLLLIAALVPALVEELLFRGAVLSGFRRSLSPVWAVLATGLVFGLFHLTPQTAFRFLPTAWLGILLAWIVVASGSLPLAVLLHFVNNASILTLTAIPLTRERLSGAEDTPPLILLPLALIMLLWGIRIMIRGRPATLDQGIPPDGTGRPAGPDPTSEG